MGFLGVVGWVSDWITTGPIAWIFHLNVVNWKQQLTTIWIIKRTTLPSILSSPSVDSIQMLSHWEKKNPKQNKQIPQTNPETKSQAKVTVWEEDMSTSQKHLAWRWWLCMWHSCRTALIKHDCISDLPFIQYSALWFLSNLTEGNFSLLSHVYHYHQQFFY